MKKSFSILLGCALAATLSLTMAAAVCADESVPDVATFFTSTAPTLATPQTSECETCHANSTQGIVDGWHQSAMSSSMTCKNCHGNHHADKTSAPTIDTCAQCHQDKVNEYKNGKHALAWDAMVSFPVSPNNSDVLTGLTNGMKGCNQCHTVGIISDDKIEAQKITSDVNPCDTCHTRHVFSAEQAADPETCAQCHIGFDHPQYEMWKDSAMGVTNQALGSDIAPSCVDCHMVDGNHGVKTAWGFIGLRYPESDEAWLADRVAILQSIGVIDKDGNFTDRLGVVQQFDIARLTTEEFDALYNQEKANCQKCHSKSFVETQFTAAETVLKEADGYMAEAIKIVQALYDDGIIEPNEGWEYNPDMLYFFDSQNVVDGELFKMFLSYRNRAFQGAFHMNADYTYWYGIASMQESLDIIKAQDVALRAAKAQQTQSIILWVALGVAVIGLACGAFAIVKSKKN